MDMIPHKTLYHSSTKLCNILVDAEVPDEVLLHQNPRPHQLANYHTCAEELHSADYSEVGTGKSLTSYLYMLDRLFKGHKVLVLMPPGLVFQYRRNFEELVTGHSFSSHHLKEDPKARKKLLDLWASTRWPDVLFMSLQMFVITGATLLRHRSYGCIVVDEAHAIGSATTKAFEYLYAYLNGRKQVFLHLMTATVTLTEVQTCYSHIKLRNPTTYQSLDQFDRVHTEYETIMLQRADRRGVMMPRPQKVIVGYKELELLKERLYKGAVRSRSSEVLSLQEPTIIETATELYSKHERMYRKFMEERLLEFGETIVVARNASALRQMLLQMITNPNKYLPETERLEVQEQAPLETLSNLVAGVDLTKTKLIIFCHFRETVEMLAKVFERFNPGLIYGASNTQRNVDKLLHDDTCRIGILNYMSGGAGFNLQPVCHHVIMYEAIGSPGLIEQALGRVQRSGQENPVVCWIFRYAMKASSTLLDKACERAGVIKVVVGDRTCFVDFMSSTLDI